MSWEALPEHNALIAGDELFNVSLNYKWRKIISEAIDQYLMNRATDDITLDNQDLLDAFYIDLYNFEALSVVINKSLNIALGANRTTTSAVFVLLAGSDFPHVPSKPNLRVSMSNLQIVHSGPGSVDAEVRIDGNSGDFVGFARMSGSTGRPMRASSVFSGLTVGVPVSISTYWKTSAPTATASDNNWLLYEIEEYD